MLCVLQKLTRYAFRLRFASDISILVHCHESSRLAAHCPLTCSTSTSWQILCPILARPFLPGCRRPNSCGPATAPERTTGTLHFYIPILREPQCSSSRIGWEAHSSNFRTREAGYSPDEDIQGAVYGNELVLRSCDGQR